MDLFARGGLLAQQEITVAAGNVVVLTASADTEVTRIQFYTGASGLLEIWHDDSGASTATDATKIFDSFNSTWESPAIGSGIFIRPGGQLIMNAATGTVTVAVYGVITTGLSQPN